MNIRFHKYQGTGNDFVMIDDRDGSFPADHTALIRFLCNRKMGIGADGVILIQNHAAYDFNMVYFNPDGSKSLCGNGSRCAIAFAKALGMIGNQTVFETTDGVHDAFIEADIIHFHLHNVEKIAPAGDDWFVNTGSPHHVRIVENIDAFDVVPQGREIRYSPPYRPAGTNVNFVERQSDSIKVRTYERGVEDETLSCGTGVTACALAASLMGYSSPVKVHTPGGSLTVSFQKKENGCFEEIYLAGPAKKVFEGNVEVPMSLNSILTLDPLKK